MDRPTPRRVEAVAGDLRERGFETESTDAGVRATGDGAAPSNVDAPLLVVEPRNGDPLTVISQVANATDSRAVPVLVGHPETVDAAAQLLASPFALRDDANGRRFHSIADRIRLTDDTFACVRAEERPRWREAAGSGGDDPEILLTAGGETLAALESVDGLRCPGPDPSAFRYRYERDERGRFAVRDGGGVVGRYVGVGAMRADGFRPVSIPLVPEHHVRSNAELARATLLATVADGAVRYRTP